MSDNNFCNKDGGCCGDCELPTSVPDIAYTSESESEPEKAIATIQLDKALAIASLETVKEEIGRMIREREEPTPKQIVGLIDSAIEAVKGVNNE